MEETVPKGGGGLAVAKISISRTRSSSSYATKHYKIQVTVR